MPISVNSSVSTVEAFRRAQLRNGRFQNTPQLNVALRSRKALNGNGSLRFAAFCCGAVQRRYYLENDDSRNDLPWCLELGKDPQKKF